MTGPRLLTIDIEVAPALAEVWGIWDVNVGLSQLLRDPAILCFAAKWYGEPKIHFFSTYHNGKDVMVQAAHDLLDEADILIHYNGAQYDVPHIKREILLAGLQPPSPTKQIDLYKVAKGQFRWISNKLQYVSVQLGLEGKAQTGGHELWTKCVAGDDAAWSTMRRYNKQDVSLTEKVYERLLPWIPNHPHAGLWIDSSAPQCPKCGSTHLQRRGVAHTSTQSYPRYQCQGCGGWARGTDIEKRITSSTRTIVGA